MGKNEYNFHFFSPCMREMELYSDLAILCYLSVHLAGLEREYFKWILMLTVGFLRASEIHPKCAVPLLVVLMPNATLCQIWAVVDTTYFSCVFSTLPCFFREEKLPFRQQ